MIEYYIMGMIAAFGAITSYKTESLVVAFQRYFSHELLSEFGFERMRNRYMIFAHLIFYTHIALGVIGVIFNFKYLIAYSIGLLLCDIFWNLKTFDLTLKEIRKMELILDLKAIIKKTLEILTKQQKEKDER